MRGNKPYANFKTAHFVKYLSSMLTDFHETSRTEILLMRQLKFLLYPEDLLHHPLLAAFNFHFNLCFLWEVWRPYSSSSDHLLHPFDLLLCLFKCIDTLMYAYIYVNVSDNYLF